MKETEKDHTKLNILLVDDRPENLLALETLLDCPDFNIIKATSGMDALSVILDTEIALVLLDVMMPEMDGYETAELMRSSSRSRNIPIIFVTANSMERDNVFKGYDAGAVDFLTKPIEPVVLNGKINVFLELHRQKKELEEKTRELNLKVVELEELQQQLEEKNRQLKAISNLDALTGIYNRRYFNEILENDWHRSLRNKEVISLLIMDIDHFKTYNDTYGHSAGDEALKAVTEAICLPLKRRIDTVVRYGGEEFAALLPGTDEAGAMAMGQQILESVYSLGLENRDTERKRVTISIGLCTLLPSEGHKSGDLIKAADEALYAAKDAGRNCIKSCRSLIQG